MTRYTVWAVFGVDADSPEQAKETVQIIVDAGRYYEKLQANVAVFINPELDKMLDEIEEK